MVQVRITPAGHDPSQEVLYEYDFETVPVIGDIIHISSQEDDVHYQVVDRWFKIDTGKSSEQLREPLIALLVKEKNMNPSAGVMIRSKHMK